jgi:ABC-2 type transport system ATP-binding protein
VHHRLTLQDVSASVGRFSILNITLAVNQGEIVGLLGHNGAGKSTTFRVVADLIRPTEGVVRLGRYDHRKDERRFKQFVAFIGDNQNVYPGMRVGEALAFSSRFYPSWDAEWCAKACHELRLPHQTKVAHLSTGMKAKLGIILGLSFHPRIAILDEPTSGLDSSSREWLWRALESRVADGELGVLISSHSQSEILEKCHRAVILEDGAVRHEIRLDGGDSAVAEQLHGLLDLTGE